MLKFFVCEIPTKGECGLKNNEITDITSKRRLFELNLGDVRKYRDLVMLFVKRDFKNCYKQTVLGPLWIIIKPFLSTFVFTVIFGMIANISSCLNGSSSTFIGNARLFGKVYFPRLVMPCANIIYNTIGFLINFVMFFILVLIYMFTGSNVHPNLCALLMPLILLSSALLGTGCGLIVSSVTTKYRDLGVLVSFGVTLWMYITPVVYPVSQVSDSFRPLALLNPVAPLIETFRYGFLGS